MDNPITIYSAGKDPYWTEQNGTLGNCYIIKGKDLDIKAVATYTCRPNQDITE